MVCFTRVLSEAQDKEWRCITEWSPLYNCPAVHTERFSQTPYPEPLLVPVYLCHTSPTLKSPRYSFSKLFILSTSVPRWYQPHQQPKKTFRNAPEHFSIIKQMVYFVCDSKISIYLSCMCSQSLRGWSKGMVNSRTAWASQWNPTKGVSVQGHWIPLSLQPSPWICLYVAFPGEPGV